MRFGTLRFAWALAHDFMSHLMNCIRHLNTRFSISIFERSALGCIDADLRDQILVGKRLTRSTDLQLPHSSRDLNFRSSAFSSTFSSKLLTNNSSNVTNNLSIRHFGVTNCDSSAS